VCLERGVGCVVLVVCVALRCVALRCVALVGGSGSVSGSGCCSCCGSCRGGCGCGRCRTWLQVVVVEGGGSACRL